MKIAIRLVGHGDGDKKTFVCLTSSYVNLLRAGHSVTLHSEECNNSPHGAADNARCRMASSFLENKDEEVLVFVGDGMAWDQGTIERLCTVALEKNSIVSAWIETDSGPEYRAIEDAQCLVKCDFVSANLTAYPKSLFTELVESKKVHRCIANGFWSFFLPVVSSSTFGGMKGTPEYLNGPWALCQTAVDAGFGCLIDRSSVGWKRQKRDFKPSKLIVEKAPEESIETLVVVDRENWAFDRMAHKIQKSMGPKTKVVAYDKLKKCEVDTLVCFWWGHAVQINGLVTAKKIIICVYDEFTWADDTEHFHEALALADIVVAANEKLAKKIKCEAQVVVIEDHVNTADFSIEPLPQDFIVGWCGNSKSGDSFLAHDIKGLEIIKAACKEAGVKSMILDSSDGDMLPYQNMPDWYRNVSLMLCASESEGGPNPVIEGCACGRPFISTDVGITRKMSTGGAGTIVNRTVKEFAQAIRRYKAIYGTPEFNKLQKTCFRNAQGQSEARALEQWNSVLADEIVLEPKIEIMQPRESIIEMDHAPRSKKKGKRTKALLISDVRDWAFHQNMVDLAHYEKDNFDFDHWFVIDYLEKGHKPDFDLYDVVFCVYHRWQIEDILPWDKSVGSLRCQWFTPENRSPATEADIDLVNRFQAFHLVTKSSYDEISDRCPGAVYLTNPVSMYRFPRATEKRELIPTWNGNAQHYNAANEDIKGFDSIIKPVCTALKLPLNWAEYNTKKGEKGHRLTPGQMPNFYQGSTVHICQSAYEGASNTVMEAMASGLAIISTDVGNHSEMHENMMKRHGESGIMIVERGRKGLIAALAELSKDSDKVHAMGALNRQEIEINWSWDVWHERYRDFLMAGIS